MSTASASSHQPARAGESRPAVESRRGIGWLLIMLVSVPLFATPFVIAAIVLLSR